MHMAKHCLTIITPDDTVHGMAKKTCSPVLNSRGPSGLELSDAFDKFDVWHDIVLVALDVLLSSSSCTSRSLNWLPSSLISSRDTIDVKNKMLNIPYNEDFHDLRAVLMSSVLSFKPLIKKMIMTQT